MSWTLVPPAPLKSARQRKTAFTKIGPATMNAQFPVPAHVPSEPPSHPSKTEPGFGVGTSVSAPPMGNAKAQVAAQSIPAGTLRTTPEPEPERVTRIVARNGVQGLGVHVPPRFQSPVQLACATNEHVPAPAQHMPVGGGGGGHGFGEHELSIPHVPAAHCAGVASVQEPSVAQQLPTGCGQGFVGEQDAPVVHVAAQEL